MSYDKSKVKYKLCIACSKPIGDHEYEEVTTFARFGQMLFKHKGCVEMYSKSSVSHKKHFIAIEEGK